MITITDIQNAVCREFNITREEILSKSRQAEIAHARHVAVYITRELCDWASLNRIGPAFNRDHSSVCHSYGVIAAKRERDPDLAARIDRIINGLAPS